MDSLLDLSLVCRTCLSVAPRSISVHSKYLKYDLPLKTMISRISSVEFKETDEFPDKLCYSCAQQLHMAYAFQQMCENSHDILCNYRKQQLHDKGATDPNHDNGENEQCEFDTKLCDTAGSTEYKTDHTDDHENAELKVESATDNESHMETKSRNSAQDDTTLSANQCSICKRVLSKPEHLKRHMASHTDSKPFRCTQCPKSFARSDNLQKHIQTHSEVRNFQCEMCDKCFKGEDTLKNHQRALHNDFVEANFHVCPFCKCFFSTTTELLAHSELHKKEKNFVCDVCGKQYAELFLYTTHVRKHANKPVATPFVCSHCGKQFSCKRYLTCHLRIHQGRKQFLCAYCDKGFLRRTDLKVHESYHTETKNYTCQVCEKSFHTPYSLKTHMRTHTGEKPYKCPHCPKAFNQNYDMLRHVRRHTGERFKCDKCEESFIHAYFLNSHLKAVHNVEAQFRTRVVKKVSDKNVGTQRVSSELIKQKD